MLSQIMRAVSASAWLNGADEAKKNRLGSCSTLPCAVDAEQIWDPVLESP